MVVVISCNHFPDDERIYHKQIKSLLRDGHEVLYYTRSSSSLNLSDGSITHTNLSVKFGISVFIGKVLKSIKPMKNIHQVQIHEVELLPIIKKIKNAFPKVLTIYDVHENMEALYRTFSNRIKLLKELSIKFRNYNENRYLKYVDHIILANPPMGLKTYENQSTTIIENFPKIEYLSSLNEIKNRKKNSVLYHGHFGPERGLKELVYAMKEVIKSVPNASLSLVGTFRTKNFGNEIKNLIEKLELHSSIKIRKQVPHSEIWGVIKSHNVGVIPFRRTPLTEENTPTKLFEMMICGLELVVSKLPPAQYFVNNSVHWCDPDNIHSISQSLISALNVKDDLSNIHENQRLVKEKYNWERKQKDYLTLFKDQ